MPISSAIAPQSTLPSVQLPKNRTAHIRPMIDEAKIDATEIRVVGLRTIIEQLALGNGAALRVRLVGRRRCSGEPRKSKPAKPPTWAAATCEGNMSAHR